MERKIMCPKCSKLNETNRFCIFCGEKLPLVDIQISLMKENPQSTCLNCGRPVEKGQLECECGYVFSEIPCPE